MRLAEQALKTKAELLLQAGSRERPAFLPDCGKNRLLSPPWLKPGGGKETLVIWELSFIW